MFGISMAQVMRSDKSQEQNACHSDAQEYIVLSVAIVWQFILHTKNYTKYNT